MTGVLIQRMIKWNQGNLGWKRSLKVTKLSLVLEAVLWPILDQVRHEFDQSSKN